MEVAPAFELLGSRDFESAIRREPGYVLVACLREGLDMLEQEGSLKDAARQFDGRLKVWVLEEHRQDDFHVKYRIMGTPTYILFEDGVEVDRTLGKLSSEALTDFVSRTMQ